MWLPQLPLQWSPYWVRELWRSDETVLLVVPVVPLTILLLLLPLRLTHASVRLWLRSRRWPAWWADGWLRCCGAVGQTAVGRVQ